MALLFCLIACEKENPEAIESCEPLTTSFEVFSADRTTNIASVQTSPPCAVGMGPCGVPGPADAGAPSGCGRVLVRVAGPGTCTLTVVSGRGEAVTATIEIRAVAGNWKCRDDGGTVHPNAPYLQGQPGLPIRFDAADAGSGH